MASAKSIENHIRQLLGDLKVSIDVIRNTAKDLGIDLENATVEQRKVIVNTIKLSHSQLVTVDNNQTEEITTPANTNQSEETNMLALLDNQETTNTNTLTTTQKHELVKIKSVELGIELSDSEIISIADMVESQITDSLDFLDNVAILISDFFKSRNSQARQLVNSKVDDIKKIINTKNEELGDIFNGANQTLIDIAQECNKQKTDYKSSYKTRLESIREILKLPA